MNKVNQKLIQEIDILLDLMKARIVSDARRDSQSEIKPIFEENFGFFNKPEYKRLISIKKMLSTPFNQNKINLFQIYRTKINFHQSLTHHQPEDFRPTPGFLFKYIYSPVAFLLKWIDFLILEKLLFNFFSFRLATLLFPNTIIFDQFDKIIKGAEFYNARIERLKKKTPTQTSLLSKLPKDILENITLYLPAKDLEPMFSDRCLQVPFKPIIKNYQVAANLLIKQKFNHCIEKLWSINPRLLTLHKERLNAFYSHLIFN